MPESTFADSENDRTLYPHSTDFEGRPPPPKGGYSWDQIRTAIECRSLHTLRRTDKGQYEYEVWLQQVDRVKYDNVGRFIALMVLQWPDLIDPADAIQKEEEAIARGKKKQHDTQHEHTEQQQQQQQQNQEQQLETMTKEERYAIIPPRMTMRLNHYPFPVQESIQYFVLWSTRDMSVPTERARLDQYLEEQFVGDNNNNTNKLHEDLLVAKK
ncbi:hypothetical protein BG004_002808, partial [Podila humilis]